MGTACTKSDAVDPYPCQITHVECKGKWSGSPYSNCSVGLSTNASMATDGLPPPNCFPTRRASDIVDAASQCMLDLLPYPALVLDSDQGRLLGVNMRALLLFQCPTMAELEVLLCSKYEVEVRLAQQFGAAFRTGHCHPRALFIPAVRSQVMHNPYVLPDDRQVVLCSFFPNLESLSIEPELERQPSTISSLDSIRQMNHDLRTPLSICIGIAEILQDAVVEEREENHLETLLENLHCLQERITQLLTEQGQASGCCLIESFCLEEVVHDVASHLPPQPHAEARVQIQAPGPWPQVLGHLSYVLGVLRRLMRLFSSSEKVTRLVIGTQWPSDKQFQVRMVLDGLSPSDLKELAGMPAFMACRQMAQTLGGDLLAAESADGSGTWEPEVMFTGLVQDRLCSPSKRLFSLSSGSTSPVSASAQRRVLVVDDIPINRHILAAKCQRLGFHDITLAIDGRDAVDHLSREKFDLVLMDVQMPGLDGVQATELVRCATDPGLALNKDVPILAVTAQNFPQERERCLAAGFTRFCPKPLADDVLRCAVAEIFTPACRR